LSDAFTFEELERHGSDQEGGLEMKSTHVRDKAPADAGNEESSCAVVDDEAAPIPEHEGPIVNPT
jgi:hypothetical protein